MKLPKGKKIYFGSDFHLGWPNHTESLKREKMIVTWLESIRADAAAVYLLGDIFDFWHEWKRAAPQGHTRFLGKIAEMVDSGIPIHLFTGNHDIWIFDYLPRETGVILHKGEYETMLGDKRFFMAHGDGLGPWDKGYKLMKWGFTNPFLQWMFAKIHPDWSLWLGQTWSQSRKISERPYIFKGKEQEWLVRYAYMQLEREHYDFFVFGHRHIPVVLELNEKARFINLGEWMKNNTYGIFDGEQMTLKSYTQPEKSFLYSGD